ncbi:MAG: nitroreductase family deazaflavin-dependent oxidoreductase, partial [Actinobacteria bacterium]|nr:nitroreductase family deazaflavin-dependent oxidoreductase [Actinomycetota bacterium]
MNESTAHTLGQTTDHNNGHRYLAPGWFTRNVFNRFVNWLARRGVSVVGSRELRIVGRSTGAVRTTVVNLLTVDGRRYLVAPRGTTQWVRNLRAAGVGELRLGRRTEQFSAAEVAEDEKVPILRHYLQKWAWEVGAFFDGVGAKATDEELRRIGPDHPIFRLSSG